MEKLKINIQLDKIEVLYKRLREEINQEQLGINFELDTLSIKFLKKEIKKEEAVLGQLLLKK